MGICRSSTGAGVAQSSPGLNPPGLKRPEGMARELYNLLYTDGKDGVAAPIIPTDSALLASSDNDLLKGYKQMRAKLGMRKVITCIK